MKESCKDEQVVGFVEPIADAQRQQVIAVTQDYIQKAGDIYQQCFAFVPVRFDLRGRAAGMYQVRKEQRLIRYNPWLFARYFADNLAHTVPHEVAHYVIDLVYGHADRGRTGRGMGIRTYFRRRGTPGVAGSTPRIRPHGREWQALMAAFGVEASRTCDYDLAGIPVRTQGRHEYHCLCSRHRLSTRRHNKIRDRSTRYFCRRCRSELVPLPSQK